MMKQRCYNKNHTNYKHYGARGIRVCDEWYNDFSVFVSDMGDSYTSGLTLDRIDNNGNYCKDNCKWSNQTQQSRNMRRNVLIEFNGETKNIAQWVDDMGMPYAKLHHRLNRGWDIERALTTK